MATGQNSLRLVILAGSWSAALFVLPWWLPLIGAVPSLATPLPLVAAYVRGGPRDGRRATALAFGVALLVSAWGAGTVLGGLFFLYYAALATALGETSAAGRNPAQAMAGAALAGSLAAAGLVAGVSLTSGMAPLQLADSQMNGQMTQVIRVYQAAGMDATQAAELKLRLLDWGRAMVRLGPGLILAGSMFLAWINWLSALRIKRAGLGKEGDGQGLTLFKAPENLVWPLIAAGAAVAFAEGWLFWLGGNLLVVLGFIYFLQGMAVASFWLDKKNVPAPVKVVLYVLLAVEFYAAAIVAGVGLFDIWFDFRRLDKEDEPLA